MYGDWGGTSLHRNDDGYSGGQGISTFRFFGRTYSTLYVSVPILYSNNFCVLFSVYHRVNDANMRDFLSGIYDW